MLNDLNFSGHVEAAVKSYKQALILRPEFPEATCNLLHTLQVYISKILDYKVKLVSFTSIISEWSIMITSYL
jgi:hypothetical protein